MSADPGPNAIAAVTGSVPSPWPALRTHPLLGRLPAPALSRLLAQMDAVSFAPGQCLTREGDRAEAMYLITDGQAERLCEGTEPTVLGANALAGQEAAGLTHHVHTVRALTGVQAWRKPSTSCMS